MLKRHLCAWLISAAALGPMASAPAYAACVGDGPCRPQPDPEPEPPLPPLVSAPDLAFQAAACPPTAIVDSLTNAIRASWPRQDCMGRPISEQELPEFRTACVHGTLRIGAWYDAATGRDNPAARERGLAAMSVLRTGETFSFAIESAGLRSEANECWQKAPKRLNGSGQAADGGAIHLKSMSVSFVPDEVSTVVKGFHDVPFPDAQFTASIRERMSIVNGGIACSASSDLDVETSVFHLLTGIVTAIVPPLGIPFAIQSVVISSTNVPSPKKESVGCAAVKHLPRSLPVPNFSQLDLEYTRVAIGPQGIVGGGNYTLRLRAPVAKIAGKRTLTADPSMPVSAEYSASATEMLPPVTYFWSSTGALTSPQSARTWVKFAAGKPTGNVTVRVVDSEGLSATSSLSVSIKAPRDELPVCSRKPDLPQCAEPPSPHTDPPSPPPVPKPAPKPPAPRPDDEDDKLPPICRRKPDLPQCN